MIVIGIRRKNRRLIIFTGRYFSKIREGSALNYSNTFLSLNKEWQGKYTDLLSNSPLEIREKVNISDLMKHNSFLIIKADD